MTKPLIIKAGNNDYAKRKDRVMKREIMQMKIELNYIVPKIWRRFIVDSSISLHRLHEIVQDIMGW